MKRSKNTPPYFEVEGDILKLYHSDASAIIAQINNCVARRAHYGSFTWQMCQIFPYADPYIERKRGAYPNLAAREDRPELGSLQLRKPHSSITTPSPSFACCFSQYRMGSCESRYYNNATYIDEDYLIQSLEKDSYVQRLTYFARSLHALYVMLRNENMKTYKKIVFPKYIGSGFAGGNWEHYDQIICKFASKLKVVIPDVTIYVVHNSSRNERER